MATITNPNNANLTPFDEYSSNQVLSRVQQLLDAYFVNTKNKSFPFDSDPLSPEDYQRVFLQSIDPLFKKMVGQLDLESKTAVKQLIESYTNAEGLKKNGLLTLFINQHLPVGNQEIPFAAPLVLQQSSLFARDNTQETDSDAEQLRALPLRTHQF